jgi:indole-3-glycerol phosphate synthase
MSADFLQSMASASRQRVAQARRVIADAELRARAVATASPPPLRLSGRFDVIAEVKLRSPAAGVLRSGQGDSGTQGERGIEDEVAARVRGYADAGAAAISVLTEPSRFDGELAHLTQAVQALAGRVPVMRKDFLVDPYQVYEARAAGAGGVLIILRMLNAAEIEAMLTVAAELSQFVLLEAFDAGDLEQAASLVERHGRAVQLLVGINCRDLVTLQVVPDRLMALAATLPRTAPRVAESGVETPADVTRLVTAGYDLALVGSALMRSHDAPRLLRTLIDAGRSARGPACG